MHKKLENNENFSDTFPTWIIAYCIDTDSFFCTNQRYFFLEYNIEFQNENDAINYFRNNINKFKEIRNEIADNCGGIQKDGCIYLENTKERWN